MNGGRADASTSTDDVKGRPLCLFYFTHPFGVLSPEPPTVTVAPQNIARTYVNMEPVPPYWNSSSSPGYDTTSTRPSFELGNATINSNPINLVRNYELDLRRESVSSSLFSSDMWFSSSASSRFGCERRVVPYNKILPPLQLPTPRDLPDFDSSDDVWPKKCFNPGKFSLPPIEMPVSCVSEDYFDDKVSVCDSETFKRHRRVFGVRKQRSRTRAGSVRRMITYLIQRNVRVNMGYVLDYCPSIETCFGIQLRIATFIISILGLAWAALYIYLFSPYGAAMLEDMGLPNTFSKPLRYFHGLFGVLLCAVHILLFFAAKYESDALCELYVWFLIVFISALIVAAVSVACVAIVMGNISFALFFQSAVALTISVSLVFGMVVANFRMELP